jgi:DNA polymerase-3 subunit beta
MTFQLECDADQLASALIACAPAISAKAPYPVLRSVRVDGAGLVVATDLTQAIRAGFDARGDGVVNIDYSLFAPKIRALRTGQSVRIEQDGDFVIVKQGRTRWKVPTLDGSGFPVDFTAPIEALAINVERDRFVSAMQAARVIGMGDGTLSIDNVLLDSADGHMVAVGAASRGLVVSGISDAHLDHTIIVPRGSVSAIASMFKSGVLTISADQSAMTIASGSVFYKTKLIEGHFPDWRRASETQSRGLEFTIFAKASEVVDAVKRAATIAEDRNRDGAVLAARMTFDGEQCRVLVENKSGEEGEDYFPATGGAGSIAVNVDVFLANLASLAAETIAIRIGSTAETAIHLSTECDSADYRIIMPMRVK